MNYEDRVTKQYLEDAIANAGAKIATGSWVGDGTAPRTISLPFEPKLLVLFGHYYSSNADQSRDLLAHIIPGFCLYLYDSTSATLSRGTQLAISGASIVISNANYCNHEGLTVRYVAFG